MHVPSVVKERKQIARTFGLYFTSLQSSVLYFIYTYRIYMTIERCEIFGDGILKPDLLKLHLLNLYLLNLAWICLNFICLSLIC
jgi:hypothetical protein